MARRLCAVSVDLDEIPNYFAIHGLPEPRGPERSLVYDVAIDRLLELAADLSIPLTLFAIGSDLARSESAERLREAHQAGCEIANHTLDHPYDFVRLGRSEMVRQVAAGARAIEHAVGARPVGFRAPGYTVTDEVMAVLTELGVEYDSSVFPCPAYWGAKAAALGAIALRGRRSRSILDTPAVLLAPTRPYRVGRPYWRRGAGLLELPVQVTRGPRLPFFGTSVTLGGPLVARRLARARAPASRSSTSSSTASTCSTPRTASRPFALISTTCACPLPGRSTPSAPPSRSSARVDTNSSPSAKAPRRRRRRSPDTGESRQEMGGTAKAQRTRRAKGWRVTGRREGGKVGDRSNPQTFVFVSISCRSSAVG